MTSIVFISKTGQDSTIKGNCRPIPLIFQGGANISGIVFYISNSKCPLLLYRRVIDCFILTCILKPCYNHLFIPGVVFVLFWWFLFLSIIREFLHIQYYHLWTKTVLFLLSQSVYWLPLFSLFSLTALARTFSIVLNRKGQREHPCLVPNLRRKTSSFFTIKNKVSCSFLFVSVFVFENQGKSTGGSSDIGFFL